MTPSLRDVEAVDLFAGPGGWDVAARRLGLEVVGIEIDADACRTRSAAGFHNTVEGDVRRYGPKDWPTATGLIASPPCQTFSLAGKGGGRAVLDEVARVVDAHGRREEVDLTVFADERTGLVLEPLRWVMEALDLERPFEWLAFEQVPFVQPIWDAMAVVLTELGYRVDTGTLLSEQYGVPQSRKRAVLVAHMSKEVRLPAPTHSKYWARTDGKYDPDVKPWVSMAEALGWGSDRESVTSRQQVWEIVEPRVNNQSGTYFDLAWPLDRPSPVIAGRELATMPGANANRFNGRTKSRNDGIRLTAAEAGVLQTFPRDYPWTGTKREIFQQIGNAVPPLMAEAILAEVAR
jgi:DNA (cytosine-5)-methyltransferase 1